MGIEAVEELAGLPVTAYLVNCCAAETITKAMAELVSTGVPFVVGYANTFETVPDNWMLDIETDSSLDPRTDLSPEVYAAHFVDWLAAGATVVGGYCGTTPAYIGRLSELLI